MSRKKKRKGFVYKSVFILGITLIIWEVKIFRLTLINFIIAFLAVETATPYIPVPFKNESTTPSITRFFFLALNSSSSSPSTSWTAASGQLLAWLAEMSYLPLEILNTVICDVPCFLSFLFRLYVARINLVSSSLP